MKKFERLTPGERKKEICTAALALFREKGFAATTMENIVAGVSLSKGGVYRLYPSTTAILSDLILEGMRLRNAFYETRVRQRLETGGEVDLPFFVDMIGDSLLLYPEISGIYAEFLWEKRRNPQLEELYRQICATTVEETDALIRRCGAEDILGGISMERLTDLMNAAVLSIHTLGLESLFSEERDKLSRTLIRILTDD